METDKPAEPDFEPAPRRVRARGAMISRFKGFDDDDDFSASAPPRPSAVDSQVDSLPTGERSQRYSVSSVTDSQRIVLIYAEWCLDGEFSHGFGLSDPTKRCEPSRKS